jgi:hypothetical protein
MYFYNEDIYIYIVHVQLIDPNYGGAHDVDGAVAHHAVASRGAGCGLRANAVALKQGR